MLYSFGKVKWIIVGGFEEATATASGYILHCAIFHSPQFASELRLPVHPNLDNSFTFFFAGLLLNVLSGDLKCPH